MAGKGTITIDGETWELKPLRGLKAIRLMPKVISILSELAYAASVGGMPLDKWLLEGEGVTIGFGEAIQAINFMSDALGKRYDEFECEIVPFLLQRDHEWLSGHGSIGELLSAIWAAILFHFESSFGKDTIAALKNSVSAQEAEVEKA